MEYIYLDNNATTRVAPQVLDTMLPYLSEYYGNASSTHGLGNTINNAVKVAREQVTTLIGYDLSELIFTLGAIRFSPRRYTTIEDVRHAVEAVKQHLHAVQY